MYSPLPDMKFKRLYFLGIGGIGMSAIARYFKAKGFEIYGYDRTVTALTKILEKEGMVIHYEENVENIPSNIDFVVYTPAVPAANVELEFFRNSDVLLYKRAQVLGMLSQTYRTIACAGTHGKTTTSTMVSHIMHNSAVGCQAFLGGIARNYETNVLISDTSDFMVAEADEFDRSFLQLFPYVAIITSVDADHLDIYQNKEFFKEGFERFTENIKDEGYLIIKKGIQLKGIHTARYQTYTYALDENADFYANNLRVVNGLYHFDFYHPAGDIKDIVLGIPGLYNVENAVAAIASALICGVKENEIKDALQSFRGVKRRFEIRYNHNGKVYIDDYAHHPEELKAAIQSARAMFPGKKLTGIFQPHLYTRTRDFADDFAESLSKLDEVILLPIYPARELPIEGINSEMLLRKITQENKSLVEKQNVVEVLKNKEIEILLTMGAGDIDTVVNAIEAFFDKKYK